MKSSETPLRFNVDYIQLGSTDFVLLSGLMIFDDIQLYMYLLTRAHVYGHLTWLHVRVRVSRGHTYVCEGSAESDKQLQIFLKRSSGLSHPRLSLTSWLTAFSIRLSTLWRDPWPRARNLSKCELLNPQLFEKKKMLTHPWYFLYVIR